MRVHQGMRRYRKVDNSRMSNISIQESTGAGVDAFSFEEKLKPAITESKLGKREKPVEKERVEVSPIAKSDSSNDNIFTEKTTKNVKRQKISLDFDVQELFDANKLQQSMSEKMGETIDANFQKSIKKIEKQLAEKMGKQFTKMWDQALERFQDKIKEQ